MSEKIRITGTVVHGNRLGREMGFPTANITVGDDCPVRNGVWAATVAVDGALYRAVADIGYKPSVGGSPVRILEAHLLGFAGDLYGRTLSAELKKYIREERKFSSIELLRARIAQDCREAELYFEENPIQNS